MNQKGEEEMRNPGDVVKAIKRANEKFPEQRICQLLSNALELAGYGGDPYYVEDDVLVTALYSYSDRVRP